MLADLETHEIKKLVELLRRAWGQGSIHLQWLIFDLLEELEKRAKREKKEKELHYAD